MRDDENARAESGKGFAGNPFEPGGKDRPEQQKNDREAGGSAQEYPVRRSAFKLFIRALFSWLICLAGVFTFPWCAFVAFKMCLTPESVVIGKVLDIIIFGAVSVFMGAGGAVCAWGLIENLMNIRTRITVSEAGLSVYRSGRLIMFLDWNDLAETGIAGGGGGYRTGYAYYFSSRHLKKRERTSLSFLETKKNRFLEVFMPCDRKGTVWISCDEVINEQTLRKNCPIPIPQPDARRLKGETKRYDYCRREKLPDGSWGEASMSFTTY